MERSCSHLRDHGCRIIGPALPLALALALALAACTEQGDDQQANGLAGDSDLVENLPVVPRPSPPLDRAGLLAAVAEAASLTAAGAPASRTLQRLDGRPFEVRIRFGCRGPSLELDDAWLGWAYDAEQRRLRVRARPTIAAAEPLVAALNAGDFEDVEGFWLPRPWLRNADCPAAAAVQAQEPQDAQKQAPGEPAQPTQQSRQQQPDIAVADPVPRSPRIGIAQFFTDTDARTGRRQNRPFESIKILEEGQPLGSQGFNLVLTGRLRALPGKGVVLCSARGPDSPPECIVSADFDRVWIENPGTGEVVAEWSVG